MVIQDLVAIVDDDESVRQSLPHLLRSFGFACEAFASAESFLRVANLAGFRCLILDIAMPGMSGIELQQALSLAGWDIPTVFITAHADEATCKHVLDAGAVACLMKPFEAEELVHMVNAALGRS
jgi:FixJ family two-component response regulator